MRVYTRKGDKGETGLLGGERIRKDHIRTETYGTVDELNSQIGAIRALLTDARLTDELEVIQRNLLNAGSRLAGSAEACRQYGVTPPGPEQAADLEQAIDRMLDNLPKLEAFILPGGSPAAAQAHIARTVCRRAERRLISLLDTLDEPDLRDLLVYINRLSDYLYALARTCNALAGGTDTLWREPTS